MRFTTLLLALALLLAITPTTQAQTPASDDVVLGQAISFEPNKSKRTLILHYSTELSPSTTDPDCESMIEIRTKNGWRAIAPSSHFGGGSSGGDVEPVTCAAGHRYSVALLRRFAERGALRARGIAARGAREITVRITKATLNGSLTGGKGESY